MGAVVLPVCPAFPVVVSGWALWCPLLRLNDVLADFAEYPHMVAAGYLSQDFDDNSVVCHARRLTGHPQEGFISASALVIRCGTNLPFFPSTYNEDWLFFFMAMLQARHTHPSSAIKFVGAVHQQAYYPFNTTRARSEELGDVLAEGLFSLLDDRREDILTNASSVEYWQGVVWYRQNMILDLLQKTRAGCDYREENTLTDIDRALRASLAVYDRAGKDWASLLAEYFRLLLQDTDDWHQLLNQLTPRTPADTLDTAQAFEALGLSATIEWLTASNSEFIPSAVISPLFTSRTS